MSLPDSLGAANMSGRDPTTWNVSILTQLNEEMFSRLAPAIAFFVALMLVGVVGNVVVCYIFTQKLRKSTQNFLLLCLGVFDLLSTVVGIPSEIWDMSHYYLYDSSPWACKWMRFLTTLPSMASILVLMVIAVDRYRKVCKPLHYQIQVSWAKKAMVVILIISLVFSLPALYIYGHRTFETPIPGIFGHDCSVDDYFRDKSYPVIYEGVLASLFVLFTAALVSLYIRIWMETRRHREYMRTHASMGTVRLDDSFYTSSTNYDSSTDNIADDAISSGSRRASGSSAHKKSFLHGRFRKRRSRTRGRDGVYNSKQGDKHLIQMAGNVNTQDTGNGKVVPRKCIWKTGSSIDKMDVDPPSKFMRDDSVDNSVDVGTAKSESELSMKQLNGHVVRHERNVAINSSGDSPIMVYGNGDAVISYKDDKVTADIKLSTIEEGKSLDSSKAARRKSSKRQNSRQEHTANEPGFSDAEAASDKEIQQGVKASLEGNTFKPETLPGEMQQTNQADSQIYCDVPVSDPLQGDVTITQNRTSDSEVEVESSTEKRNQESLKPNRVSFYKYLQQMSQADGVDYRDFDDECRQSMLEDNGVPKENPIRPNGSVASFLSYSQDAPLKSDRLFKLSKSTQSLTAKRVKKALSATRTTVIASVITLGFILSYLPHLILVILRSVEVDFEHHLNQAGLIFYNIFVRSYFVNNVINIFVYGSMNLEFRTQILRIWELCRRRRKLSEVPVNNNFRRNTAASVNLDTQAPNGKSKESQC